MDKNKKEQAEKLQIKLDKLLQTREKKQVAFDKAKKEIADLNKNIDSTKLKLFEILQSGSDDMAFSNWAKRKIGENGNAENSKTANIQNGKSANRENASSDDSANPNSAKSENTTTPTTQNHNRNDKQNHHGRHNQQSQPTQNAPCHTGQNHNPQQS